MIETNTTHDLVIVLKIFSGMNIYRQVAYKNVRDSEQCSINGMFKINMCIMRTSATIILMLITFLLHGQTELPQWGRERIKAFSDKYVIASYMNPKFIEADLSGDNNADLAILIERKMDKKKGVLILFGNSDRSFLIGAGTKFGKAGDDFEWANEWNAFKEKVTYETRFKPNGDVDGGKEIRLDRQAISIREEEGAGGLIYFNGKEFIWIHQGD